MLLLTKYPGILKHWLHGNTIQSMYVRVPAESIHNRMLPYIYSKLNIFCGIATFIKHQWNQNPTEKRKENKRFIRKQKVRLLLEILCIHSERG